VNTLAMQARGSVIGEEWESIQARHFQGQRECFAKYAQALSAFGDFRPPSVDPSCSIGASRQDGVDTGRTCAWSTNGMPGSSLISSSNSRRSDRSRVTAARSAWATRTERIKRVIMADVDEMPERRYSTGWAIVFILDGSMVRRECPC
ncbi:uncharacterized protein THITE_2052051, partial [Thermothielavioides terrestris NRRL 8126]